MKEKKIYINGNETQYTVTSSGDVYSLNYGRTCKKKKLTKLSNKYDNGYVHVNLRYNKKMYRKKVHRLVAEAFVKNTDPENKTQVNHINGDKHDNRAKNLEWVTAKENTKHAIEHSLRTVRYGEKSPCAKLKKKTVEKICSMLESNEYSSTDIAEILSIPLHMVINIKNRKCWIEVSSKYNIDNHTKHRNPRKHVKKTSVKITVEQAIDICKLLQDTELKVKEISKITGVNTYKINSILYGNSWRKVSENYDFSNRRKV